MKKILISVFVIFSFFEFVYSETTITVTGRVPYIDTGVDISDGDVLKITASGSWCYASWLPSSCSGPDGATTAAVWDLLVKTAPQGALVGRIGSGDWFFVGSSYEETATSSGRLLLACNDNVVSGGYGDNTGSVASVIKVTPGIQLTVGLNPSAVRPGENTTVTVKVTKPSGEIISNHPVSLTASAVIHSGGHQHNTTRPVGSFSNTSGNTGSDGKFTTTYTASAFGGQERITATSGQYSGITDTETLDVRIPGLVQLGTGTGYTLTGGTVYHPLNTNHYGTNTTVSALGTIASEYIALYPGSVLRYNDISLEKGGLFD